MPQIKSSELATNTPLEGNASDPMLIIDPDATPLKAGVYHFQLEVVDNSGNRSAADFAKVVVRDDKLPTAVIDTDREVPFGKSITLSGKRSSDIGGSIVKFIWTLIP